MKLKSFAIALFSICNLVYGQNMVTLYGTPFKVEKFKAADMTVSGLSEVESPTTAIISIHEGVISIRYEG
jgi:hypothetical protein